MFFPACPNCSKIRWNMPEIISSIFMVLIGKKHRIQPYGIYSQFLHVRNLFLNSFQISTIHSGVFQTVIYILFLFFLPWNLMAKIRSPSISVKLLLIFIFRPFIFLYKILLMKFIYFKCFRSKFIENRVIVIISVIKSVRKYIVPYCFLWPVWYFKYLNVFLSCFHRKPFRFLIKCQIFSIKICLDSSVF